MDWEIDSSHRALSIGVNLMPIHYRRVFFDHTVRAMCVVCLWLTASASAVVAQANPVAQIVSPVLERKLRAGETVPLKIRVEGSAGAAWSVALSNGGDTSLVLASGNGSVDGGVGELSGSSLTPGDAYKLVLTVADNERVVTATTTFNVPDPQFTLIPLEQGNMSIRGLRTYAVDAAGDRILYSPDPSEPAPLVIIRPREKRRDMIEVPLTSNEGVKFSGDASYLFFKAIYPGSPVGLWSLDLSTNDHLLISDRAEFFFNVSHDGGRVAFQTIGQFFLYDRVSNQREQITDDPDAISTAATCPAQFGSTPLITADGTKVFVITSATLGLSDPDPTIGCRIFSYDVAGKTLKQIVALPSTWLRLDIPALSADGRWLSFMVLVPSDGGAYRGTPALLDTVTGEVAAPAVDVGPFTSFDAVITADGNGLVLSTQADIDSRVGNRDHNLELFYYDRSTGIALQMTETVGGIGRTPGGCASRRPAVSRDASVAVFPFSLISVEGCQLDGPQRNERDGLSFGFARAVRRRPNNRGVMLDAIPPVQVAVGSRLVLNFQAQDDDGDLISFFAQETSGQDVPPRSTITDHGDGTATFEWTPLPEDVGEHLLRVAAFDEGGGEMFQDVSISVLLGSSPSCIGSCDDNNEVTADEILRMVSIALGTDLVEDCTAGDADGNGSVTIDEILSAVANALSGCPT